MNRTLNQLIESAVLGGEEAEQYAPETTKVASARTAPPATSEDLGDIEKIASALEFLGRRGVASLFEKEAGKIENNAGSRPGGGKGAVDTTGCETGTHHPSLASNDAAIGYDKKTKTERTSKALKKVLATTPYADGTLKKHLTSASGKGDKNIHSKSAHDTAAIRAELERRAASQGGA